MMELRPELEELPGHETGCPDISRREMIKYSLQDQGVAQPHCTVGHHKPFFSGVSQCHSVTVSVLSCVF